MLTEEVYLRLLYATLACSAVHFTCHWQAVVGSSLLMTSGYSRPQPSYALCLHFFFASTPSDR